MFTIDVIIFRLQFIHAHVYVFPHTYITVYGGTSTLSLYISNLP